MIALNISREFDELVARRTFNDRSIAELRRMIIEIFRIESPFAPGLKFVGARCRAPGQSESLSVGGTGLDVPRALESCLGEAIERISQIDDGEANFPTFQSDGSHSQKLLEWAVRHARQNHRPGDETSDWLAATHLGSQGVARVPADLCLRRPPEKQALQPRFALSTGCAAGRSYALALTSATFELIERDAASMWWLGGRKPSLIEYHGNDIGKLIGQLRQGVETRQTFILDITTDLAIPCVAALSIDHDGFGLACGLAARATIEAAATSALLEMCQMEMAVVLVRAKARAGATLNTMEVNQLRRASEIDIRAYMSGWLSSHSMASPGAGARSESDGAEDPSAWLSRQGVDLYAVDLTHPRFGVPVARVIAPSLQLMPCEVMTSRLVESVSANGGGIGRAYNLPLL